MSKSTRSSDHDVVESATLLPGGSGSPASGASVPVQETNILQILEQHLPKEHGAVVSRIRALEEQLTAATNYREQLEGIASVAGVTLSPTPT